jgi:hypothetical protein
MGMFDEVRIKYPLPWPEVQDALWQSKDTPEQSLDLFEIREDGTLWHEQYAARVEETDESPLGFYIHRDNPQWRRIGFNGSIEVHHGIEHEDGGLTWYSATFWFKDSTVADTIFKKTEPEPKA